ncbi:response regulator [Mucilaginibacter sp. HD30]
MKRIMIIDDDPDILAILQEILNEEGYRVITFPDKNSVKGIIINRPDLVLLDNRLKDGLGYELCREIKSNSMTSHIPVVLMSAHQDLAELARLSGADSYMSKPFDISALLSIIEHLIKISKEPQSF